jgi:hypothetical protein
MSETRGDARDAAEDIMRGTLTRRVQSGTSFEEIRDVMKAHGPGLVSLHWLISDTYESNKFSYTGTRTKPKEQPSGHAMVAVGVRKDANDKVHFLLQNFWKNKEFIKIDYDYLDASGGKLHF